MSIDTEIQGSPSSIRDAARWLGQTLAPAVDTGSEAFADSRRTSASDWDGATARAFEGAMTRAVAEADEVGSLVRRVRSAFQDFAGSLERCQERMTAIRDDARAAELTVSGFVIEDPGPGPSDPGPPPTDVPQATADAYDARVEAWNDHQTKVRAFNRLVERADEVWTSIQQAWDRVAERDRALDGPTWALNLGMVAGGLGGALAEVHSSVLRGTADDFGRIAAQNLERLRSLDEVFDSARFYDDLRHYGSMADDAAATGSRAAAAMRVARALPLVAGGALTGLGIYYDMTHGGESAEQAVASNVGGFAASVGAGALVGTAIGGPVGTVAGVIVGAGVGVFTSGMIDGLWQHDGNVADAAMAGLDTLADTGGALLDGAQDVGGAIVDGIGGLF